MLTYMCLGCKMKDYVYFLSFKEPFYKIRFTNISLNRKKKIINSFFFLIQNTKLSFVPSATEQTITKEAEGTNSTTN